MVSSSVKPASAQRSSVAETADLELSGQSRILMHKVLDSSTHRACWLEDLPESIIFLLSPPKPQLMLPYLGMSFETNTLPFRSFPRFRFTQPYT